MEYTDKELLELAALAAGYKLKMWCEDTNTHESFFIGYMPVQGKPYPEMWSEDSWNPLVDDGEAMRLAIRLSISVTQYPIYEYPKHSVVARVPSLENERTSVVELYGDCAEAANRRAIVRSAAELGLIIREGNTE